MTSEQYADKLKRLADLNLDVPLSLAAIDTLDEYHKRIFVKSKKTDGSTINYVSDKPIYVNPSNSPKKFTPEGKTKKRKFESGLPHKTKYFDSYKSFKEFINKPILELFGELQSSVANGLKKESEGSYVISVPSKEGDKIEGLQFGNGKWDGFGTIFKFNKKEKEIFFETFKKNLSATNTR